MTLICVVGMGMLVVSQHYFTQRLIELNQQRNLLLRMGQDLLQMRRHEKDFLMRHQQEYFQLFIERSESFSTRLNQLTPLISDYDMPMSQLGNLAEGLDEYQQLFQQVVALQTKIGLTPTSGLLGQMINTEGELLSQSYFDVGSNTLIQLDGARLAIRDFQLTHNNYFATLAVQSIELLAQARNAGKSEQVDELLSVYKEAVGALAIANQTLGLTHNEGLIGRFRRQAHNVEQQLTLIDNALQPIIENQEQKVKIYSISIAVLTSVLLILILVKSFATFHRAFSNFVMFFYRCKRQYQRMDPRKLGFAEFKSLAELANEMVESRQAIEERLAVVEAELAQKQRKPETS
ncbi:chemotaxis protein [Alteromonas sp. KS69]|jgi:hypothetical protein|nr:chemotaxis protein [Alteromonas sp. KS69]|tara:strand:- start:5519 stop:6562 length:1044 start_codon:yes stop_codon:yes gene_type:complete